MRLPRSKLFCLGRALFLSILVASAAKAQTIGFSAADYGKVQLPMRQSTGDAANYIDANKGAFEPISELDPNDPLAALAKPIGRVDVLLHNKKTGEDFGASCTGELLAGDYVLTNHHCLPIEGDLTVVKASILMNYLTLDGKGTQRFDLDPKLVEWNPKLDYAIARANGRPTTTYGAVRIGAMKPGESRSMLVIHHPMGRPKVMSRFRCMVIKDQGEGNELRHRCDTLGGSSGSILIDSRMLGVALHKEGGLDPKDPSSFNTATSMASLIEASPILKAAAAALANQPDVAADSSSPQPPVTPMPPQGADTKTMNDILRGQ